MASFKGSHQQFLWENLLTEQRSGALAEIRGPFLGGPSVFQVYVVDNFNGSPDAQIGHAEDRKWCVAMLSHSLLTCTGVQKAHSWACQSAFPKILLLRVTFPLCGGTGSLNDSSLDPH